MALNMKTTVEIEDRLLRQAKRAAIDRNTTLRDLIARGLRRELAARPPGAGIEWVTASGTLPQDLNLADRNAMWDWLGTRDDDRD